MAHIKNNLGIIAEKEGRMSEAEEYYETAYEIKKGFS